MAYELLDSLTKEPGIVLIVGAASSGKSTLLQNYFCHLYEREKVPIVFFTLEYSAIEVINHLLAIMSSVELRKIYNGSVTDEEFACVEKSAKHLMEPRASSVRIVEAEGFTVKEITEHIQKFLKGQSGIVLIDYLDLLNDTEEHENQFETVTVVLRKLKTVAMELGVSIVVLKHMRCRRGGQDCRLTLDNMKSPANLEPYTDSIIFQYITEFPCPDTCAGSHIELEIVKCSGHVKHTTKRLLLNCKTLRITTE